ncbi:MAG TPA: hypothetical protein VFN48_06660 [Solirubrobacteraceae bacterium]|nr:hypothetical protein [Solirubrobacteraceae bacterium]
MRRAAVLAAAVVAGLVAGCGGGGSAAVPHRPARLCVDVGLAPHGAAAAASQELLAGLRSEIPPAGVRLGGSEIGLCRILDDGTSLPLALAHARSAARDPATVAYLGELFGARAAAVETMLAPAGLALLSPSGRIRATAGAGADAIAADSAASSEAGVDGVAPGTRGGPENPFPTLFSLAPSDRLQVRARRALALARHCGPHRRARTLCVVLGPAAAPLCTPGPALRPLAAPTALCVLAGVDLAGRRSPAYAYGEALGQVLLAAARAAAVPGAVLSRSALLQGLSGLDLRASAIGRVRFTPTGADPADLYSVYTVGTDGHLSLSETFRAH